jgi:membrane protein DedA with SNARE-associated domain
LKAAHALSAHRILGKVFFTKSQLEVAVRWFGRYGAIVIFFSRLIPGFRTIVSFPAGAVRMPLVKFTIYTTAGCLIWNGLLIYVGYWLGSRWTQVANVSHNLIIATVAVLVIGFVVFMVWRHRRADQTRVKRDVSL